ncbi:hypothetical protein [Gimesia panareensis]|uniref:hypothetical protein n=1 Tax=Gimesia panareensis TaxID=2527978 RepID=UPI0011A4F68E|nr:hypothetical protein [Gimesia panareensis]
MAFFEAMQRFFRIRVLDLHRDRKTRIEVRSTLFLPLAGFSLGLLITVLLVLLQFLWPLEIAVLLTGALELLFLRTFVPESIPQCREFLDQRGGASSPGNLFVLTIVFMLLRVALFYQLFAESDNLLAPSILILISISLGTWIIPFSISVVNAQDETARWVNPQLPLSLKQLGYGSLFLIPVVLVGSWLALRDLAPALIVSGLVIYWIMRKLEDHDAAVTDVHLEGLASLFQILFLLACTIDFSFLKTVSE